jgi:predicted N-acyltransferase
MTSLRAPETDTAELEPERLSSLEEAGPDWDRLAQASENIFATTTWIDCWSRHTADIPKRPYYWTCRRADGSVAAILPLVLTAGRYGRKLRFAGFGAGWRLGPICAREDLEPACAALRRVLSETGREWDIFVAEDLPGEGWAARLQGRHLYRLPCPVVRFEWKDWDEYLDSRPRRTRHELRRLARRAEERGLVFRTIDCEQELPGVFDTLVEQHLKRWGDHASPWFVGRLELHRDFTREALRWPRRARRSSP